MAQENDLQDIFNESITMYSKIKRQNDFLMVWSVVSMILMLYIAYVLYGLTLV